MTKEVHDTQEKMQAAQAEMDRINKEISKAQANHSHIIVEISIIHKNIDATQAKKGLLVRTLVLLEQPRCPGWKRPDCPGDSSYLRKNSSGSG